MLRSSELVYTTEGNFDGDYPNTVRGFGVSCASLFHRPAEILEMIGSEKTVM